MKLQILICYCNIEKLIEKEITFGKRHRFSECRCKQEHEVFVVLCENYNYNITVFRRDYFTAINCFSLGAGRHKSSCHYITLQMSLNKNVHKICIS